MKQDSKATFRSTILIAASVLFVVATVFFISATFANKGISNPRQEEVKVQVYLNENDSIINRLQQDVSRLTTIIEDFQADTSYYLGAIPTNGLIK